MATVAMVPGAVPGAGWDHDGFVVRRGVVGRDDCQALVGPRASCSALERDPVVAEVVTALANDVGAIGVRTGGVVSAGVTVTLPGASGARWARSVPGVRAAVVAVVALVPATLATGCPWVVPGSHRAEAARDEDVLVDGAVAVPLDEGDALVLDARLLHRRTDNHSIDTNALLIVAFGPPVG